MPEGPEVKVTAEALNKKLKGKYLLEIVSESKKVVEFKGKSKIEKIVSYGKKIIFCLEDKYLVSSLGMEGKWRFDKADLKHIRGTLKLGTKKGICIVRDDIIYFDDSRGFGSLVMKNDLSFLNKLGPDILSEDKIDLATFKKRFDKYANRQICQALLEQSIIAGVGNYLKSDILYCSMIDPSRVCSTLEEKEWNSLYKYTYELTHESYRNNGLTIRTYFSPDGKKGSYAAKVYGREKDDLGNKVVKIKSKDGRGTYWVPSVQK